MSLFAAITMIDFSKPLAARRRRHVGPYRWTPSQAGKGRGFYSSQRSALEMDRAGSSLRLRLEEANDHLGRRLADVNGYYCDADGYGDTMQPVIARLPRGRGFLAGWTMGAGMCGSLDATIYADAGDAARAAHAEADRDADAARCEAEAERDHDEDADEGE